ncbi:hypothetical protein BJ165DRAFT_833749 [Panaeolus papilionaceus]|nr:hypothetical protein BJ165DRAFT_833749 [Panaeolus papilionaceus]
MASTTSSSTTMHYPYKPNTILRATFLDESDAVIGMPGAPKSLKEMQLKVIRTLATTLSCVLLVEPVGAHQHRFPRQLILKVYDERFADNIREDNKMPEWTPAQSVLLEEFKALPDHLKPQIISKEYDPTSVWWDEQEDDSSSSSSDNSISTPITPSNGIPGAWIVSNSDSLPVKQGRTAQQTPKPDPIEEWENVETVPDSDSPSDSDSSSDVGADEDDEPELEHVSVQEADRALKERLRPGFLEAVGELTCGNLYQDELAVYRHLNILQGKSIPGCYGSLTVQPLYSGTFSDIDAPEGPKALLLQYIDHSFTLRDVPEKIPNTSLWSDIGKAAVKLVQDIGDLGVLNRDVRLDNFLVVPVIASKSAKRTASKRKNSPESGAQENKKFKVVMIDFGLARVWDEDEETEEAFRRARLQEDEEGAVGCVFENHLCKALKVKIGTEESPFRYRPSGRLHRSWDFEDDC